jgi:uncharacterized protein (DUF305 family)
MSKELIYGLVGLVVGAAISGLVVFNQVSGKHTATDQPLTQTSDHSMMGHDMNSMSMKDMSKELEGKSGNEFDKTFIEMMIPHHQGAIDMAELALENAEHQEIKDLAEEIISAQKTEIEMMKDWQSSWGY